MRPMSSSTSFQSDSGEMADSGPGGSGSSERNTIDMFDTDTEGAMDGKGGKQRELAVALDTSGAGSGSEKLCGSGGGLGVAVGGEVFKVAAEDAFYDARQAAGTREAALEREHRYGQEEGNVKWSDGGSSGSSWGNGLGGRVRSSESLSDDPFGSPKPGVPPNVEVQFVGGCGSIMVMMEEDMRGVDNPRWRRSNAEILDMKLSREDWEVLMDFDMMSVDEELEILAGRGGPRQRNESGSSIDFDDDGILLPEPLIQEELLGTSIEKAFIESEREERRAIDAERSRKRKLREESQAPKVKTPRLETLAEEEEMEAEHEPQPHKEEDTMDTLEILEMAMPDMEMLEDDGWRETPLPDEPISPREGRNPRRRRLQEDERRRSRSRSPNYAARSPSPPRQSPRPRTSPVPDYHNLAQNLSQSVLAALEWLASSTSHGRDTLDLVLKLRRASFTLSRIQKTPAIELKIGRVEKNLERISRLVEELTSGPAPQRPKRNRRKPNWYGSVVSH